ncbi:hypothetical protein [Streptomyces caelestis]
MIACSGQGCISLVGSKVTAVKDLLPLLERVMKERRPTPRKWS